MDFTSLLGIVLFLIILFYRYYYPRLRSYYVNSKLIRDVNPEMFLYELDKDINKAKSDEYRHALLVNKASGLIFIGKWKEAIELLDSIGDNFNNEIYTIQYYLNYITAYIFLEKINIAKGLFLDKKELFEKYRIVKRYKDITISIKKIEGVFSFYDNDLNISKNILEESLNEQKYSIYKAINHYFLGKILEKQGDLTESKMHFSKAKILGEKTFLSNLDS